MIKLTTFIFIHLFTYLFIYLLLKNVSFLHEIVKSFYSAKSFISTILHTKISFLNFKFSYSGIRIYAIFGFCDIHDFEFVTQQLGKEVLSFVNTIAEIVHTKVHNWRGQCNKNLGTISHSIRYHLLF